MRSVPLTFVLSILTASNIDFVLYLLESPSYFVVPLGVSAVLTHDRAPRLRVSLGPRHHLPLKRLHGPFLLVMDNTVPLGVSNHRRLCWIWCV